MALHLSLAPPHSLRNLQPLSRVAALSPEILRSSGDLRAAQKAVISETKRKREKKSRSWVVRASLDTTVPVVGQVTEVNKDTFWPLVHAAGDKTVVLDMYTKWCGPCKVIAPKFQELSEKYQDVIFLKLDCNQENKALAKELGIKVVPTFKILKDNKLIKEVTGAKYEDLVVAIETVRSS